MSPKKVRPAPNTRYYASSQLILSKNQGLVDSSCSLSSCPSSSSFSDEVSTAIDPLHRLKYTIPEVMNIAIFDISGAVIVPHKSNKDKSLVIMRNFFSTSHVKRLRELFRTSKLVYEIKDRKSDLHYSHNAYRAEVALRLEMKKVYKRIMEATISVCDKVWGDIRLKARKNRVMPEIEYIVYDVAETPGAEGTFIEPHVDNHSIVTGVSMLSEPDVDFVGGVNRFKGSESDDHGNAYRECKLGKGDLVLFRGEVVTHWITPVVSGRREILQWELSRI